MRDLGIDKKFVKHILTVNFYGSSAADKKRAAWLRINKNVNDSSAKLWVYNFWQSHILFKVFHG